jgi:hypothetical protein
MTSRAPSLSPSTSAAIPAISRASSLATATSRSSTC